MTYNPYLSQIEALQEKLSENQALLGDPELGQLAQEEITLIESEMKMLEDAAATFLEQMQDDSVETDSTQQAKAIIELRQGAGGDEAKIWSNDLLRMYLRFIETQGLQAEFLDDLVIRVSGRLELAIPSVVADGESLTTGPEAEKALLYPYELFKYESGVHRVQRVPATEAQGRIHTSTASVAVLPEITSKAIDIREEDLEWQFIRSSGAGGQSVNKTSSAVRLTHIPSGIAVSASTERKQVQNRQIALSLLRSKLWQIEEDKRVEQLGAARSAIGRNMRAEKIRTYNYPQNRVTDHRINQSWYMLDRVVEGDLGMILGTCRAMLEYEPATVETPTE